MDDRLFLAWAAGFFDGEGCVLVSERSNKTVYQLFTTVTQQEPAALHLLKQRFGGNVTPDKTATSDSYLRKRGAILVWRWKATSAEAHAFLQAIQPYVVVKAEQVRVALDFPDVGVRFCRSRPMPEDVRVARRNVMHTLRSIRAAQKTLLEVAHG
jgi:hypothetical protein